MGSSSNPLAVLFAGKTAGAGSGGKVYICGYSWFSWIFKSMGGGAIFIWDPEGFFKGLPHNRSDASYESPERRSQKSKVVASYDSYFSNYLVLSDFSPKSRPSKLRIPRESRCYMLCSLRSAENWRFFFGAKILFSFSSKFYCLITRLALCGYWLIIEFDSLGILIDKTGEKAYWCSNNDLPQTLFNDLPPIHVSKQ